MDPTTWIESVAAALGVPVPDQQEVTDLLAIASTAAHTSERWAAPVTTALVAGSGMAVGQARALVDELAAVGRPEPGHTEG